VVVQMLWAFVVAPFQIQFSNSLPVALPTDASIIPDRIFRNFRAARF